MTDETEPSCRPSPCSFSDRPHRLTGHLPTDGFVAKWGEGDDSFVVDPPNALLSQFDEDTANDVVMILTDPMLANGNLSYAAEVPEGQLSSADSPVSLFIDTIGRSMTPISVAGVRRRGRRRARRRMRRRF